MHLEGSVLGDLLGLDAGMQRQRAHLMVGSVEVEHAEVGHHPEHVDEPVCGVGRIDLVPADSRHHVDGIAEHPLGVIADPVARRVVDGVPRCTAHSEHLAGGMLKRAECGQVLIPIPVNLIGTHDDVAPAPCQRLEDAAERHPALDRACGTERGGVGQQPGLAVGQQDVGGEGQPRESGSDGHHVRHRAHHDLASIAEEFGARDGAHLGSGHGHHLPASFAALAASANFRTAAW